MRRYNLWHAEAARIGGPFAKADRDHIGDDATDVALLSRVVVGSGMVARHGHGPGLMLRVQLREEARGIVDIATRIEHVIDAAKLVAMITVIYLHAAEVNQRLALAPRIPEGKERL